MSTLSTARARLATALSAAAGTKGYPTRPPTPKEGDAWPVLVAMERGPGGTFMIGWRLRVMLPADEVKAAEWIDNHLDLLYDAVEPVAYIDAFRPVALPAAGGDQFALEIEVRSE